MNLRPSATKNALAVGLGLRDGHLVGTRQEKERDFPRRHDLDGKSRCLGDIGNDAGVGELLRIDLEAEADCWKERKISEAICPSIHPIHPPIHLLSIHPFMHSTSHTTHLHITYAIRLHLRASG